MKLIHRLRQTRLAGDSYRRLRTALQGPGWGGFHGDQVYRGLIFDLLDAFQFTSFVETGTSHGYSTELVASSRPNLPIFTSEVMPETYDASQRFLNRYENITMALQSSDEWLDGLLKSGALGALPLLYLDAHWQSYWPLRAELRHLSDARAKAVIVIDDFEVPGRPDFGFDIDGGGEQIDGLRCNVEYIRPSLGAENGYKALFPTYTRADAFGSGQAGPMRGHIVLFQNAGDEHTGALGRPFIQEHYTPHDEVG